MAKEINLFGEKRIIRILYAERFKKPYTVAIPPPWYKNPRRLSKGQVAQIIRFSKVAHETAGKPLKERMRIIAAKTSGPTGFAKPKIKLVLPNLPKLAPIARAYGLEIPESLLRASSAYAGYETAPRAEEIAVIRE